jgi:hypothetical protein
MPSGKLERPLGTIALTEAHPHSTLLSHRCCLAGHCFTSISLTNCSFCFSPLSLLFQRQTADRHYPSTTTAAARMHKALQRGGQERLPRPMSLSTRCPKLFCEAQDVLPLPIKEDITTQGGIYVKVHTLAFRRHTIPLPLGAWHIWGRVETVMIPSL